MENELKNECIERLRIMEETFGLHKVVRTAFEEDETLYYSETTKVGGILWWISNDEKYVQIINEFEKKYNAKVYFCILSHTKSGKLLDILFVPGNEEDKKLWDNEKENIKQGYAKSYCKNLTDDSMSKFESIAITGRSGEIIRVG